MSDWIPVSERLPEMTPLYTNGPKVARVLAWSGHYVFEAKYEETFVKRVPVWKNAYGRNANVTHWMPLPAPPTSEQLLGKGTPENTATADGTD